MDLPEKEARVRVGGTGTGNVFGQCVSSFLQNPGLDSFTGKIKKSDLCPKRR